MSVQYDKYGGGSRQYQQLPIDNEDDDDSIIPKPASEANVHIATKFQPKVNLYINLMVLTVFLQSIGFTLMMPSMVDYLQYINPEFGKYNGWVVACYSAGQFLSSPLMGYWSNRRPTREPLIVSIVISIFGNFLYAVCYLFGDKNAIFIMATARFIVGIGAGNVSVCRAFASESSDISNKTTTMAKMSGAQGAGFVLGPAIGFLLAFLHAQAGEFLFNEYTSPAYLSVLTAIFNVVILLVWFNPPSNHLNKSGEKKPLLDKQSAARSGSVNNYNDGATVSSSQTYTNGRPEALLPVFVSIYLFAVVISIFAVFETILAELTKADYGWQVKANGVILGSTGLLSVVVFVIIAMPFIKKIDDRKTALFGFFNLIVALFLLANYGEPFYWENSLPKWQFLLGSVFVSIGYPIASSLIYAIFSKVLNPKQQGTKMGWLTAGGSLARMLGPIWAQSIWNKGGGEILFLTTAGIAITGFLVLSIFYTKLTPHPDYSKNPPQPPQSQQSNVTQTPGNNDGVSSTNSISRGSMKFSQSIDNNNNNNSETYSTDVNV